MFCAFFNAQQKKFVLIDSQTKKEFVKKDSLSAVKFLDSLAENNYYFTKVLNVEKQSQTTKIIFDKGKNYNEAQVKISDEIAENLKTKKEFHTKNLDSLKKNINKKYIDEGFAFSRVKAKYLGIKNEIPQVEISVNKNEQRKIDGFVFRGYDKLPKRFVKNLEKEYKGKPYDAKQLTTINKQLQNHPFLTLEKPPQTLFTKDSTQIFLFTQKRKSNTFDGVLGFGNSKTNKITFNGSFDVNLKNMFNGFETISLFWQRTPERGQNFDLQTDIPYLFKSNIGFNANVNIYRQDSTYANAKLLPAVYFHISEKQKIGLRGNFEKSTVKDYYTPAANFSRNGVGIWYELFSPSSEEIFQNDMKLRVETDFLKSKYDDKTQENNNQLKYFVAGEKNFHIKGNHYLNVKAESAMLSTKGMLSENEIFRIGGWNSLRGFNERSILANFYAFTGAEYRYLINPGVFVDVFGQLAQIENKTLDVKPKFYSFGLGFNYILPIGLMTLQISNGNEMNSAFHFKDTKIHWGILTKF